METNVPIIFKRTGHGGQLDWTGRCVAAFVALLALALLVIAARLKPSPDGLGTHREMGLDQCAWLERTGLPCPSCGMTTSFAWFVRGNFAASIYVQPMGAMLAALTCMTVWAGAYIAITGNAVHRLFSTLPARYHVLPLLVLALLAWAWKIYIHLHGIDGWK